ncbi:MAG: hypothetical protein II191_05785 [Clostridia bacterium]|nr:hypothetical protein [Clostridia bacterium]
MKTMKTTDDLTKILKKIKPDDIPAMLEKYESMFFYGENPFADYMRGLLAEKNIRRQDVFLAADIPEGYGYKLLTCEKRTRRRDVMLRIFFAAGLTAEEMQRGLKLLGLSPLYPRIPRDAVLMVAAYNEMHDIEKVNALLIEYGFAPLESCGADKS